MREIRYRDRTVAMTAGGDILFAPHIAVLEDDHPQRRWVAGLATFSFELDAGTIPHPYADERAALYARALLMPFDEFLPRADQPDHLLAEHFVVPLEQVDQRRRDLVLVEA